MTSKVQPLDLGIIKNFKVHYRYSLLSKLLVIIDSVKKASDLTKLINNLMAINWITSAWHKVTTITIKNSFAKAGIGNLDSDVLEENNISDLIENINHNIADNLSVDEFLNCDVSLETESNETFDDALNRGQKVKSN